MPSRVISLEAGESAHPPFDRIPKLNWIADLEQLHVARERCLIADHDANHRVRSIPVDEQFVCGENHKVIIGGKDKVTSAEAGLLTEIGGHDGPKYAAWTRMTHIAKDFPRALPPITQGGSPVRKSRSPGSVRGGVP